MRRWSAGRAFAVTALVAAALTYGVHVHNRVARSEEQVLAAWRQVRNVEQRRSDLIPQLVRVTEAYAAHEQHVLEQLADTRSRYLDRAQRPEGAQYLGPLDSALTAALFVAEQYPELHGDELYRRLSFELRGSANRIVVERMRYNEKASAHRALVRKLPFRFFSDLEVPIAPVGPDEAEATP